MPRELKTTVYTFNELSDDAKEKAREWYRGGALDYDWWDCTYEDAASIGLKITSFECYRYVDGQFTQSASTVAKAIIDNHGPDCDTTKTAKSFLVEMSADDLCDGDIDDLEHDFLKSLCEDYRIMLDHEYEYLLSDECVDETILGNEYTFTADGRRQG